MTTATTLAEEWTGRSFINTTWDYALDESHPYLAQDCIDLPRSPLSSITSITGYADDNSGTALSSAKYYAITNGSVGRVALVNGNDWPTDLRQYDSVVIRFVAGYGSTIGNVEDRIEEMIKRGVLLTVGAMYENRGDERPGGAFRFSLPEVAKQVLAPLRVVW